MTDLTVELLKSEAKAFAEIESNHAEPALYGVTDGKAVGMYFEHKFQACLHGKLGVAAARQDGVGEGVRCVAAGLSLAAYTDSGASIEDLRGSLYS